MPERRVAQVLRFLFDDDLERAGDFLIDLCSHLVFPDDLDGLGELNLALIQLKALLGKSFGNVGRGNRAEELVAFAGLARKAQGHGGESLGLFLRGFALGGGAFGECGADFFEALQRRSCGFDAQLARQQIVARVARRDFHDLAARAEFFHIFLQNNLHRASPGIPVPAKRRPGDHMPVANGSRAMLRARLMASPSQRWWREHVPVMRRGRILPRSCTKGWSISTFLKSIKSTRSTQNRQTFFLRKNCVLPLRGPPGPPCPPCLPGPPSRRGAPEGGPLCDLCSSAIGVPFLQKDSSAISAITSAARLTLRRGLFGRRRGACRWLARTPGRLALALALELLLAFQLFVEAHRQVLDDHVRNREAPLEFANQFALRALDLQIDVIAFPMLGHAIGHLARAPLLELFDLAALFGASVLERGDDLRDFLFRRGRPADENQVVQPFFHVFPRFSVNPAALPFAHAPGKGRRTISQFRAGLKPGATTVRPGAERAC